MRNIILLLLVAISFLMHHDHFSKDLMGIHVWRQTQTQSTINNFYEEDMNILNPRRNDRGDTDGIERMEFPLMQWMVACTYKVFGNHLIITRIFMFLIGVFSILGMYKLILTLFRKEILALTGAWAFNFSPSFYYYTINPIPDNLALCCSIWGLTLFFIWYEKDKLKYLIWSGFLFSIGALCKLPFIVYFIVPATYFIITAAKNGMNKKILSRALTVLAFSIPPLIWYVNVIPGWHGNAIVKGMLGSQDSIKTILDYLQHNLVSNLPELLLNYGAVLFFLAGFYYLFQNRAYKDRRFPLILALSIAVLGYFLFEINAIAKIHDYYLFPFYPLLFMLVAYGAGKFIIHKIPFIRYLSYFLIALLPFTCYLRMHNRWDQDSPGFNKDLLIHKKEFREAVPKNALVVAGNDASHYIFLYYVDKKGWTFEDDNLSSPALKTMIDKGAEYLYTDSRSIDGNQEIASRLDTLILEKGSVRIYRLIR